MTTCREYYAYFCQKFAPSTGQQVRFSHMCATVETWIWRFKCTSNAENVAISSHKESLRRWTGVQKQIIDHLSTQEDDLRQTCRFKISACIMYICLLFLQVSVCVWVSEWVCGVHVWALYNCGVFQVIIVPVFVLCTCVCVRVRTQHPLNCDYSVIDCTGCHSEALTCPPPCQLPAASSCHCTQCVHL